MTDDPRDWIAVAALPGLGPASLKKLWEQGWTPCKLLRATEAEQLQLRLPNKTKTALTAFQAGSGSLQQKIDSVVHWQALHADASVLTYASDDYPSLLKEIHDPPPILLVRGDPSQLVLPQLAIVGSRHASSGGLRQAHLFSKMLTQSGVLVTSGLALGIDAAAHQAAVDIDKPTIAVLGTGPDKLYPARNRALAMRIIETGGAIVSEFLPGTPPVAANFPRRNRIISGLSSGVLVIEAAAKSGSLITARYALEQGREVFALPGSINNPMSRGCHQLIREGAVLVETSEHIFEQMGPLFGFLAESDAGAQVEVSTIKLGTDVTEDEKRVLNSMGFDPCSVDQLASSTGASVQALGVLLIGLELKGYIEPQGGGYIRLG